MSRAGSRAKAPRRAPPPAPGGGAWLDVALIAIAVAAAYANTLRVPFILDDYASIRENPLIYHWQGIGALWRANPMRSLTYLTFALNHRLGGFDPLIYHLTNLKIHVLAGLALYGFARGALRAPRLAGAVPAQVRRWLPVTAALIFVLHPLQTQAVTYIVQRLASLVALGYFVSLAAYVQARLSPPGPRRALWAGLCVASMLL
ncbi:MAG: hypothetical protein E6K81_16635, partial [Candidatus Eisenbacteria bacterium]